MSILSNNPVLFHSTLYKDPFPAQAGTTVIRPLERLGIFLPQLIQVGALHLYQESGADHARGVLRDGMAGGQGVDGPAPVNLPGDDGVVPGAVVDGDGPGHHPFA